MFDTIILHCRVMDEREMLIDLALGIGLFNTKNKSTMPSAIVAFSIMKKINYLLLVSVVMFLGTAVVFAEEHDVEDDVAAPAAIEDLAVSESASSSITLTWTSPGDDAVDGLAALYDIRYSSSTITNENWADAVQAADEPDPKVAGADQSMVVEELSASTTYFFAIKTSDEVPNVADLSNVVSGATLAEVDEAPPVISAVSVSDITETGATIVWTTDEEADSLVEYGETVDYGSETDLDTELITSHSVVLSGLTLDTTYHFRVTSKDASDNEVTSEDYTFVTSTAAVVAVDFGAEVKVTPRVLNLKSGGRWITVRVVLPEGYNAQDVDMDSLVLNDILSPNGGFRGLGYLKQGNDNDDDEDGEETAKEHNRLSLKFSRQAVRDLVPTDATEFEITISGTVGEDTTFSGTDTVRVMDKQAVQEGEIVQAEGDFKVYQIINGKKRHIPSPQALERMEIKWRNITEITEELLGSIEEDVLVRVAGLPQVYLIVGDKLYHIPAPTTFISYGFDWDDISTITLAEFRDYKKVNSIKRVDDPKVYILKNGKKHWVPSSAIFQKNGFDWDDVVIVNATDLDSYPEGEDIE